MSKRNDRVFPTLNTPLQEIASFILVYGLKLLKGNATTTTTTTCTRAQTHTHIHVHMLLLQDC